MKPTIGNWYRIQGSDSFEVVAFDEDDGTIELQYFDGTVEEMDLEDWQASQETGALEEVEPPEDWTGSVDVDPEDTENEFDVAPGNNGSSPFDAIDRGEADGYSELELPDEPNERPAG